MGPGRAGGAVVRRSLGVRKAGLATRANLARTPPRFPIIPPRTRKLWRTRPRLRCSAQCNNARANAKRRDAAIVKGPGGASINAVAVVWIDLNAYDVINSNSLERDAGGKVDPLFLIPR